MNNKEDVENMFSAYFHGLKSIYNYFGVKKFDTYDYELTRETCNWKISQFENKLHWEIPTDIEDPEGTYSAEIHGIFRKEFHTLIFVPSGTGHAGFALIFDNDQEIKDSQDEQQRRY